MVSTNRKRWNRASVPKRGPAPGGLKAKLIDAGGGNGGGLVAPRFFDNDGNALFRKNGPGRYDTTMLNGGETGFFDSGIGFAIRNSLGDKEKAEKPFEENVWIRACAKAKRAGFGQLEFKLFPGDPLDKDIEALDDHPILELLADPNPMQTEAEFWRAHATNFLLDGDVFWFLMDDDGEPVSSNRDEMVITDMPDQILIVRGDQVEHKVDKLGMPEWFRFPLGGKGNSIQYSEVFHRTEVVHFCDYDPDNPVRGLGDVKALFREVDLYFQGMRYLDSSVRNGGDPGGFIIFDERLTSGELQRRQDEADEQFNSDDAGRYKLLDRKAKFVPNTTKPKDMEYMSMFEWTRDAICSGMGVPPPVIGVYTDATYNNIETAHREMWTGPNGILAFADLTIDIVQHKFIGRLSPQLGELRAVTLRATFDSSNVKALQEDSSDKLKVAADIAAQGVGVSYNEAKAELGIEAEDTTEGGDTRLISASLDVLEAVEAQGPGRHAPALAASTDFGTSAQLRLGDGDDNALTYGLSIEPDPKLRARISSWLGAFEKAQIAKLRKIASKSKNSENAGLSLTKRILASDLTEDDIEALLLNEETWAESLDRKTRAVIRDLFEEALRQTARDLGAIGGNFVTVTDPSVVNFLASHQVALTEGVTGTLAKTVRSNLLKGLSSPGGKKMLLSEMVQRSLPKLTENLRRVFGTKEARANAIARTETGIAQNGARFTQMKASEVVSEIEWLAVGDNVTRDSHLKVHRTRVKLGSKFSNGLRYPHDENAPAGEVVNCRCAFRVHKFTPLKSAKKKA